MHFSVSQSLQQAQNFCHNICLLNKRNYTYKVFKCLKQKYNFKRNFNWKNKKMGYLMFDEKNEKKIFY